jgi:hypothetical protein
MALRPESIAAIITPSSGVLKMARFKPRPRIVSATPEEKGYFLAACEVFESRGKMNPDDLDFRKFVRMFTDAISERGDRRWNVMFKETEPERWCP